MKPDQLLKYIIRPSLAAMGSKYASEPAAVLMLATAAQETLCGEFVRQLSGPALGIYQMEPGTLDLIRRWCTDYAPDVVSMLPTDESVVYDLRAATIASRMLYYSTPEPLPTIDVNAMWAYYKRWYNSSEGAATQAEFTRNYAAYVSPVIAQ